MGNFFKSFFSSSKSGNESEIMSKADKKNFDIFKYDGIRAQRIGQVPYAIKCFTEALKIKEDFETMSYLVTAYIASHEFEEALELANHMIELEPENTPSYLTRIHILFLLNKEQEVITDCLRVIQLDETNYLAWFFMGKAKKTAKNLHESIMDLTEAIELKRDFTDAYLLRAELFLDIDKPKEALFDIEKAISLAPEEERNYLIRAYIHEKIGNFTAAADDYTQVLELNPFNADASLSLGSLLINKGESCRAIELFNDVIDLKPDFAKAYSERAKAKKLMGDNDGASEDEKKIIELNFEDEKEQMSNGKKPNFDDMYKGGIF